MDARQSYNNDIGLGVLMHVLESEGKEPDEEFKIKVAAEPRALRRPSGWLSGASSHCWGLPALLGTPRLTDASLRLHTTLSFLSSLLKTVLLGLFRAHQIQHGLSHLRILKQLHLHNLMIAAKTPFP